MADKNICEICKEEIKNKHDEVEYYIEKRSDEHKIMYRHEDCPEVE